MLVENLDAIKDLEVKMEGNKCAIKLVDDMIRANMCTYKQTIPVYNHDIEQKMPDDCVAIVTVQLISEKLFNEQFGIGN